MRTTMRWLILISMVLLMTDKRAALAFVKPDNVRALYLSADYIHNEQKITELEHIFSLTKANGIVIDFKDSNVISQVHIEKLQKRFKRYGVYTIARIVTFQDSYFARKHPEVAIKTAAGDFWHSGRAVWKRYWLDPASQLAQDYNIEVAKRAIDAGFDEIQFDYIRFPTDGNMRNIRYPVFGSSSETKKEIMDGFFKKIRNSLKAYESQIIISIDVFGEVFLRGQESGIGQSIDGVAEYFDVISPMAYPSHYMCREFGVQDPTAHPYLVYRETLQKGLVRLQRHNVMIRPWIQDFTIASIYGCGPHVSYTQERVADQIRAAQDLGIAGFMLWNAHNNFTINVLK